MFRRKHPSRVCLYLLSVVHTYNYRRRVPDKYIIKIFINMNECVVDYFQAISR